MAVEMAGPSSLALDVSPGFFHPSASVQTWQGIWDPLDPLVYAAFAS